MRHDPRLRGGDSGNCTSFFISDLDPRLPDCFLPMRNEGLAHKIAWLIMSCYTRKLCPKADGMTIEEFCAYYHGPNDMQFWNRPVIETGPYMPLPEDARALRNFLDEEGLTEDGEYHLVRMVSLEGQEPRVRRIVITAYSQELLQYRLPVWQHCPCPRTVLIAVFLRAVPWH